jgi:hypothetical protein
MARLILCAALVLSMLTGHIRAAELSSDEHGFVSLIINTMYVAHLCGYVPVKETVVKIGDSIGIDSKIEPATVSAVQAIIHADYDRTLLIPEVTRLVRIMLDQMDQMEGDTKNKARYCKENAPLFLKLGVVTQKN